MAIDLSLFNALRRPEFKHAQASYSQTLRFMLDETEEGWWLRAVDLKGNSVSPYYRAYNADLREQVKAYQIASSEEAPSFQWAAHTSAGTGGIEIAHRPEILIKLLNTGLLVDAQMAPLNCEAKDYTLSLNLSPNGSAGTEVLAQYALNQSDAKPHSLSKPKFITDRCVLENDTIYQIESIGPSFRAASLFLETIPITQLNIFLTLLTSTFPDLALSYDDYTIESGAMIEARPAILFKEVDEQAALYLSLADSLPQLSFEFVRDYDISRLAYIDREAHIIRLNEVDYSNSQSAQTELVKKMQKLARREKTADAYFTEDGEGGYIMGPDLAKSFLSQHLAEFASKFTIYGAEKLRRYKITHAKPKLQLRLGSGIDYLEGEGTLEVADENFSLLDALTQYRKNRYLTLSDGTQAVLNSDYMDRLSRLFKKRKDGMRVSFFDLPLIEELIDSNAANASFKKSRKIFAGFNDLAKRRVPLPRFTGQLRPYQHSGLQWLDYLYNHKLGGCLADDMGLGKTVQAIALLSRIYPKVKAPSLIVMPRSLLFNWSRELETFAPDLSHTIHHASGRDWDSAVKENQIILTTYGTLRSDIEVISQTKLHAIVLDESQAIKNLNTQTAQAALALQAKFRLALSGTPVENNLGELYTLFRFLNPAMFSSAAEFERDYAHPIQKENDETAAKELRKKIYPFILRRLKGEVLKELPPKVEQVLYVEMGNAQKKHYEERRRFYKAIIDGEIQKNGIAKSQFVILEAMLELRQIATVPEAKTEGRIQSAKSERLLEALEEAVSNGRKCLVFSNFLAGVEQIGSALNTRGISHLRMTGATTDRESLVERFQSDSKIKAFVMSLKTGGVGLNLTAADTVFILDPWWNTSAEAQAVDRAHRIGQQNTVFTYRLIAKDSIEEKIRKLQEQKQNLVDQVVSTDGSALKTLTEDDIETLFSR